jgi:hypothetical protein
MALLEEKRKKWRRNFEWRPDGCYLSPFPDNKHEIYAGDEGKVKSEWRKFSASYSPIRESRSDAGQTKIASSSCFLDERRKK